MPRPARSTNGHVHQPSAQSGSSQRSTTTLRASCGARVFRCRCGPTPGLRASPRPTTSWTRYPNGRQGIPSPPTIRSRPARTGLPWPDLTDAGAVSLLQTLRTAAGPADRANPRSPWRCRSPATSAGCRRAPSSSATPSPRARRSSSAGDPAAWCPVGLVPEFEYAERRRRSRLRARADARCRGRCTRCPAAPLVEHLDLGEAEYELRVRRALGRRRARHAAGRMPPARRRRPARHWSSRCSRRPGCTGCPTTRRNARCGCWRTPPTSTRSSPSAPGLMPIGLQIVLGDADRQRRAAAAGRRGALGADGRGQRDPALGLA